MVFDRPQFEVLLTEMDAQNGGDSDRHYPEDSAVAASHSIAKGAENASDPFGSVAAMIAVIQRGAGVGQKWTLDLSRICLLLKSAT